VESDLALHKVLSLSLLLAVQSSASERFIEEITHLNEEHQESIMRLLERLGISNSGNSS